MAMCASTMAGDAALAYDSRFPGVRSRIDVLPNYEPMGSRSNYDNYGHWIGAGNPPRRSSTARHSKSGRGSGSAMALDARSERDYASVWGEDAMRIKCL